MWKIIPTNQVGQHDAVHRAWLILTITNEDVSVVGQAVEKTVDAVMGALSSLSRGA